MLTLQPSHRHTLRVIMARQATGYATRGENTFRPSRKDALETKGTVCSSVLAADAAKFFEHTDIEETTETHIVPRVSLTKKLHLRLFEQKIETEDVKTFQTDTRTGQKVVVTNPRIVWKSDRTLLRRDHPEKMPQDISRITSKSKRKIWEPELPAVVESSTDLDLDDVTF